MSTYAVTVKDRAGAEWSSFTLHADELDQAAAHAWLLETVCHERSPWELVLLEPLGPLPDEWTVPHG